MKDAFSLWLNERPQLAEQLAEVCIANAHRRMRASKKVVRKKIASGPALPGQAGRLFAAGSQPYRTVFGGRGGLGWRFSQAGP